MDNPAPPTNNPPSGTTSLRFGTFEVDLRAGELRKGGIKIKLYGQPFNVLVALLERPGQVITREELQQKLWASDTFVDFEHSLNKAVNKVREALGDDADNPRFVETLPRRGYRFIGSVESISAGLQQLSDNLTPPSGKHANASAVALHASPRRVLLWCLSTVALATIVGVAVWVLRSPLGPTKRVMRFTITLPSGQHLAGLNQPAVALSTDGTKLAYVAVTQGGEQRIYLRAMDTAEIRPVPGTEGATNPFFSPNGQWLAFVAGGKLRRIPLNGSVAETMVDVGAIFGATWGGQHRIVFAPDASVLQQTSDTGGTARPLTRFETGETLHMWPEFLPGGSAVIFVPNTTPPTIAVQPIGKRQRRNLFQKASITMPHCLPAGYLIYAQAANLIAVPFDIRRLQVGGSAVRVVQGVMQSSGSDGSGVAQYSVSATGSLVYVPGSLEASQSRLVWVSRNGAEKPLGVPPGNYNQPRISPDGERVAFDVTDDEGTQVSVYNTARETLSRLTFGGRLNEYPVWTLDGKRIVFMSNRDNKFHIYWQLADGAGGLERLTSGNTEVPFSWSPEGPQLIYLEQPRPGTADIWVLRPNSDGAGPFLQAGFFLDAPQISPDGRWLAYASTESGRLEIYVQPYPGLGGKWQVSTEGGTEPQWSRSARELFYRSGDKMMAVEINTQPRFVAGKPKQLFEGQYLRTPSGFARANYDVSADGQRFLMLKPVSSVQATELNVVLNWTEELKRLVPAGNK